MKILLKSLGYFLLLICLLLVVLLLIPDQQYKSLAEKLIQKSTDRNVVIGELVTQRNLNPSIELKNFSLSNPDWAKNPEMLKAEQFKGTVDLVELIKGRLNIDLSSDAINLDLVRNNQGQINWQFKTDDSSAPTQKPKENPSLKNLARFVLKHLNMKDFNLVFNDEQSKAQHELIINELEIIESENGIAQQINTHGSLDKLPFSIQGSTGTISELGNSNTMPLDLKATLDNLNLSLKGKLDAQSNELDLLSEVNFTLPDLKLATKLTGQKLPEEWKNLVGSTKLLSTAGQFSLQDINIKMQQGLIATVAGAVSDLNKFSGVDIDLSAELNSIKTFSLFTPEPLPDFGPLKFTGTILSDDSQLSLQSADLNYAGEYGKAEIKGDIGDVIKLEKANLKVDLDLPNLNIAKLFTDANIPELGNIKLISDVVSNGPMDLSAKNVRLDYDHQGLKLDSTGSINSLIKQAGELDLNINATLTSLEALNNLTQSQLPGIGPVNVTSAIQGKFNDILINAVDAQFNDDSLTGSIKGNIGSITKLDNIALKTDLQSPSIGELLGKLNVKSYANSAVRLTTVIEKNSDDIKIDQMNLELGDNSISGELAVINALKKDVRPQFTGMVNIVKFNLEDLLGKAPKDQSADAENKSTQALPDSPLPFNYLRDYDVDLTIDVGEFQAGLLTLTNANIKAVAQQGKFELGPLNTKLNGGDTMLHVDIDASTSPAKSSIKVKIDDFSLKQAGTFEGSELLENEGIANANLEFSATGESIASMLANSNGNGYAEIRNLIVKNEMLKFVSGDLVSEAAGALNPLENKSKTTKFNCTAVKIDLQDGMLNAPNGYIADAEAFTITGKAKVNFKEQGLDIEVNTNPKEGLGLSLGELARAIKVGGTIESPKVELNPEGVAELGATIGAAVATGGLSLLAQGQLEKLKAKSEVCASVIK